ncbi:MAG TPA: alpha-amylase family glycosyl hydrolase [Thermoanaerobaculia bacterium]|nr:alpha-amylase family glycosyl hydrolase [Thermoanaerobaculia bacterium]
MSRARLLLVILFGLVVVWTCAFRSPPADRPSERPPTRVVAPRGSAQWQNDWTRGAVFYEVFVRSFRDSDGDGKGDLRGLIEKLDYLNDGDPATTADLGVDALWLMPVFASPSYHGYDTVDYETINPDYGTNADFARLISEAHRRGIRVIVDFVVNHTGSGHPWFADSASSPSSAHRDWYVWRTDNPGWTQPWGGTNPTWHPLNGFYFFGVFWEGMPDLNFRTPAVRREIERLASLWLDRGVDGFRLDAARHIVEDGPGQAQVDTPETHAYWKEFAAFVRAAKPQATLVGENWTDTPIIATYYGSTAQITAGDELPMNFDFPLAEQVLAGVNSGDASAISAKLAEIQGVYPPGVVDAPFLTNHDQVRVATQLGTNPGKMRNAPAILLTLPGAPFLYYGEEIGLQNGTTNNDEAKRTPMPWDATPGGGFTTGSPWFPFAPGQADTNVAAQTKDPGSLLSRYRSLVRARKSSPALRTGTLELLTPASGTSRVLAFVRAEGTERILVLHNVSDSVAAAGLYSLSIAEAEEIFADPHLGQPIGAAGAWTVSLSPRGSGVWRIH